VLVPVEDTDTEELSETCAEIEGCAEPVYEFEELEDTDSDTDKVNADVAEAVPLFIAVVEGHAVIVAVVVRVRLYVGLEESVRVCVHVRNKVRVGVKESFTLGLTLTVTLKE
jgi:hypothetical protein